MNRLFILILFAARCHSQDSCQDIVKPPNPTSDCCGIQLGSNNLEISGDATINQFPWVALIENENAKLYSTGSLISSRHVLTSAKVADQNFVRVRLGAFTRNHSGPECVMVKNKQICNDGAITIAIAAIRSHAEFKFNKHVGHDIAVIKLADKVPYSEFIRPICLPTSDVLVSPPSNLHFINAGWGRRPISNYKNEVVKHYVTLPYVDLKSCQKIYEPETKKSTEYRVVEGHVCAGGEKDLDTCVGDAGGPLMFNENGHYTLVGIVSFGKGCGTEGVPGVYIKVYPHLSWINSVIAAL